MNNDYPLISVVITTHQGRAERCKRAIESVLTQSYPNFECLVVDDGSTDDTQDMIKGFKDPRVINIRRDTN